MSFNKKELMALSAEEKLSLVEELWDSIDDNLVPVTKEEIAFAEERLKHHEENPEDGLDWEELRKKLKQKHGF